MVTFNILNDFGRILELNIFLHKKHGSSIPRKLNQ